jgi:hypothetical protein
MPYGISAVVDHQMPFHQMPFSENAFSENAFLATLDAADARPSAHAPDGAPSTR